MTLNEVLALVEVPSCIQLCKMYAVSNLSHEMIEEYSMLVLALQIPNFSQYAHESG